MSRPYTRINWKNMTEQERKKYRSDAQKKWYRQNVNPNAKPPKAHVPYSMLDVGENRICITCKQSKPRTAEYFPYQHKQTVFRRLCHVCATAARRESWARDRYGMSIVEYDAMLARGCVICGSREDMVMDHCHRTGEPRNGLCYLCNLGLGSFKDDPKRLRRAAEYIEFFCTT